MTRVECVILIFFVINLSVDINAANTRFKYKKNLKPDETSNNNQLVKCNELPIPILNNILGPAFNSRFVFYLKNYKFSINLLIYLLQIHES